MPSGLLSTKKPAPRPFARCEAARVFLPDRTKWMADFESELTRFPNAVHDDQIDSMTRFLEWITNRSQQAQLAYGSCRRSNNPAQPAAVTH
jgi:phage terminase large subunit-like protein